MIETRSAGQYQAWLHARARLMPDLLVKAPAWVRGVFDHAWAPMTALSAHLSGLPLPLWDCLLRWPGGFVVISNAETRYVPGSVAVRHRELENVAFVSVEDLAEDNERPLHVIGHLIDHQLGCGGDLSGPWLSAGGGVTAWLRQAGERLPQLFALGYAFDEVAQSHARDYFAQSLAIYCRDRRRLNVVDPQICKWFRSTLWSRTLWIENES